MIDNVNHPEHYTSGAIECIDAIEAALTPEEFRGFCKGNALKYVWRERLKGGNETLAKAAWYLARLADFVARTAAAIEPRTPPTAIADLEVLWIVNAKDSYATIDGLRVTWAEASALARNPASPHPWMAESELSAFLAAA